MAIHLVTTYKAVSVFTYVIIKLHEILRYSFLRQDLSKLNRDPRKIIYLSAHARENSLQPENGAVIKPFKSELDDTALVDFIPFLECKSSVLSVCSQD